MGKMRTMQHNSRANSKGRVHGTKHNDRNFDVGKADNIKTELSHLNYYENCYHDLSLTFEEAELKFYKENFGEQLERTNQKYIENRHPERCKTMEEWKMIRQNAPEETVMQVGKMEEHIGRVELFKCYSEYNHRLEAWNVAHGKPFTTLTKALHADEAVPHWQTRRVWHYNDSQGVLKIGQEKALAAAGVPLPDPSKPEGRRNNRKMVFDKMAREMWLDVLKERGLDIEREPLPPGTPHNMEKEEMIRKKYENLLREAQQIKSDAETARDEALKDLEDIKREIDVAKSFLESTQDLAALEQQKASENLETIKSEISSLEDKKALLERGNDELQEVLFNLNDRITDLQNISTATEKAVQKKLDESQPLFGSQRELVASVQAERQKMKQEERLNQLEQFVSLPQVQPAWEQFQRMREAIKEKKHVKKNDGPER